MFTEEEISALAWRMLGDPYGTGAGREDTRDHALMVRGIKAGLVLAGEEVDR